MATGVYDRTNSKVRKPHSEATRLKMRLAQLGIKNHMYGKKWKMDKDVAKRMGISRRGKKYPQNSGENHLNWKGEFVKYRALHSWVQRNLGNPDSCVHCGKTGLTGHKIHWANKSRRYLRDISDWIRLCVQCHSRYDKNKDKSIYVA